MARELITGEVAEIDDHRSISETGHSGVALLIDGDTAEKVARALIR